VSLPSLTPLRSGTLTATFVSQAELVAPSWLPGSVLSVWFQDYPYRGAHTVVDAVPYSALTNGTQFAYQATLDLQGDEIDALPTFRLGWVRDGCFVEAV
jgi:hypothetical protein